MESNTSGLLRLERAGPIATLTLNRPDVGNALDLALARALLEAAIACDEDDTIRCVVLTGAGRMFCAGGDVGAFGAAGDRIPAFLKEITSYVHAAVSRFAHMNKPLLTAINGPAAGVGLSLALLGDIAIAADRVELTNGAQLDSSTAALGRGGRIDIFASVSLTLTVPNWPLPPNAPSLYGPPLTSPRRSSARAISPLVRPAAR